MTELENRLARVAKRHLELKAAALRAKRKIKCKKLADCELKNIDCYLGSVSREAQKVLKDREINPYGYQLWQCLVCNRYALAGYNGKGLAWLSKQQVKYFK